MPDLIISDTYCGLPLYNNRKACYGFYKPMLERIHLLFNESISRFDRPRVAHFVINKPVQDIGSKVGRILSRWGTTRKSINSHQGSPDVLFFLCHEVRPRTKEHHAHLAVFFDGFNWKDLIFLEEKLQTLSQDKSVNIFKRSKEKMPISCDAETGEIHLSADGTPKRKTSSYYHDLNNYLLDAFERISYLAKVFSKSNAHDGRAFSSSHINKR